MNLSPVYSEFGHILTMCKSSKALLVESGLQHAKLQMLLRSCNCCEGCGSEFCIQHLYISQYLDRVRLGAIVSTLNEDK